jgi:hypothetical protein
VELQGHVDCPSKFDEFLNVDRLIPTTEDDTATSLDVPGREHAGSEGEEMQWLSAHPTQKDAFMALSVLDAVISASDADEKIVKAMDDIQDFVSKIYKQSLKQRSIESYFNSLNPKWQLYVPVALTVSNPSFHIYGFHMILTVKRDYFLKQH